MELCYDPVILAASLLVAIEANESFLAKRASHEPMTLRISGEGDDFKSS